MGSRGALRGREIAGEEGLARFHEMSVKRALLNMTDVYPCPRCATTCVADLKEVGVRGRGCECAGVCGCAQRPPRSRSHALARARVADQNYAKCGKCEFPFCILCFDVYHPATACVDPTEKAKAAHVRPRGRPRARGRVARVAFSRRRPAECRSASSG